MQRNLRQLANMKHCMLRLEGVCNRDATTTVLAHIRHANIAGMGQKPSDLCAVWACSDCHDVIDGRRSHQWREEEIDSFILEALLRQLSWYDRHEVVMYERA